MNQKIRGFFKNQWVVGAFYFLLSMIPVTIFWKSIIYYFGSLICSLLTKTEVSVYILILLPILGIFLTIVFFWILAILNKRVETQHPKYQEYTEDIIDGKL